MYTNLKNVKMITNKIILVIKTSSKIKDILNSFIKQNGNPEEVSETFFVYNKESIFCEQYGNYNLINVILNKDSNDTIKFNEAINIKDNINSFIENIEDIYIKLEKNIEYNSDVIDNLLSEKKELKDILSMIPKEKLIMRSSFEHRLYKVNREIWLMRPLYSIEH